MAALVFDLDGTLADSKECILKSIEYGLSQVGLADLRFCDIKVTQQDLRRSFCEMMQENNLPLEEPKMLEFIDHYRRFHCEEAIALIRSYEGIVETLDRLSKSFDLAVATTKHSEQAVRVLKQLKIDHYFSHIQGTDPGFRYKPEPDILLACLRKLRVNADSAAYVGDSLHDIHAARACGMKAIGAAYGFAGDQHLRDIAPDWMVYSFRELESLSEEIHSRLFENSNISKVV